MISDKIKYKKKSFLNRIRKKKHEQAEEIKNFFWFC